MMELHIFNHAMSVMDGKRCVAVARRVGSGGWMMRIHGGSWSDTLTNKAKQAHLKRIGMAPTTSPNLRFAKTKTEARKILSELVKGKAR